MNGDRHLTPSALTPQTPAPTRPLPTAEQRATDRRDLLKPLLVFLFLTAALVLVYLSPLREHLLNLRDLRQPLHDSRFGWLFFMFGVFVLTAVGMPRLVFCTLSGMIFGFVRGFILTQIATLAGYYVTFLFVRWGGRAFVLRRWPRLATMHALFDRHPAWKVVMIRQTPVTGGVINCFLALSPLRHRDFLLGTAVGLIPQAVFATLLGSSAIKTDRGQQFLFLGLAAFVFVLYVLIRRFVKRSAPVDFTSSP